MTKKWWHGKVAYQIYPKSFYDTNGDGIGDLRGVIEKLDYLKDLGVDILWLSPIYCSPLADQGYDISDYYNIDPRFGTMEEMDELIAEAKKRDMYILMDLVVNHCSDEHEWFQKAIRDPDGEYGKYFYIEESKDGKLPNNLRSYFGGSVWEKLPGSENKYYLHFFHKKQPDLNWENPKLRREVYDMINWWLEKGLAGFRIDAIMNIKKELPFKDYPADRADGMASTVQMLLAAKGIGAFLSELSKETFQKYDAFTVGEVFNEKEEEIPDFIGDDGYFSSMFDFRETLYGASEKGWYDNTDITPDAYRDCCFESQSLVKNVGFLSNIIENHDEPRGVSRYLPKGEIDDAGKKMLAAVYFLLRGLPFIFQGQEIGMENAEFESMNEIDDISSLDEYQVARRAGCSEQEALYAVNTYSRDNSRTPVLWDDSENAGFTTGKPWLRVNPVYKQINVKKQESDPDSILSFYKKLTHLRKNPEYQDTIVYGTFEAVYQEQSNLMAYYRKGEAQTILVIANFQKEPRTVELLKPYQKVLLNNYSDEEIAGNQLTLKGHQVLVCEL